MRSRSDQARYRTLPLAALAAFVWLVSAQAGAQVAADPPVSGTYEGWSSLTMTAYGPLTSSSTLLPEWIEVQTRHRHTRVTFQPEGRVVWRIEWGPRGPVRKAVEVDGALFLTARYEYDAAGHIARKTASGPGLATMLVFTYQTDSSGRVTERRSPLRQALWAGAAAGAQEVVHVTYRGAAAQSRVVVAGREVRRDEYDGAGRLLVTRFVGATPADELALFYDRGMAGQLTAIRRVIAGRPSAAAPGVRDTSITAAHVLVLAGAPLERREALLVLGSAVTARDDGRGVARRRSDDYADGCWLNEQSGFEWDPSGFITSGSTGCICGFCVAADADSSAADTLGVDLHWTRGPWLRLDDELTLTTDHEVMTPSGPRLAGELAVGDVVLDANGQERVLRSVEALEEGLRLGRNIRTGSGVFAAEGFLVASEEERACL